MMMLNPPNAALATAFVVALVITAVTSMFDDPVDVEPITHRVCNVALKEVMGRFGSYRGYDGTHHVFHFKNGPVDCKIEGDRIVWRSKNGRWRNERSDTAMFLAATFDLKHFAIAYVRSDGSTVTKTYSGTN